MTTTGKLVPLIALAVACQSPSSTTVRVGVSDEADWGLDGLRVAAQGQEEPAPLETTVTLLFPDEWADQTIEVRIDGMRADERIASASSR